MKHILAIIVLYKMRFEASPSYINLSEALHSDRNLAEAIELVVVDNSPEAQTAPPDFVGRYVHDGGNPGLARRYNDALSLAAEVGMSWLLLLDQDTTVTRAYLLELLERAHQLGSDERVVAIVPKLVAGDRLLSPHLPMFADAGFALNLSSSGIMLGKIRVYNSGAMLRASALQAIGGFPEAYWLDYLDHATFDRLQTRGGHVYVMDARLEHEMSIDREDRFADPGYPARQSNQLRAEIRFYREHGTAAERRAHRLHLLRHALGSGKRGRWGEAMRYLRVGLGGWRP